MAVSYEIYDYLDHAGSPDPADSGLLERVAFFVPDLRSGYLPRFIGDLTGSEIPSWTVVDLAAEAAEQAEAGRLGR